MDGVLRLFHPQPPSLTFLYFGVAYFKKKIKQTSKKKPNQKSTSLQQFRQNNVHSQLFQKSPFSSRIEDLYAVTGLTNHLIIGCDLLGRTNRGVKMESANMLLSSSVDSLPSAFRDYAFTYWQK